MGSNSVGESIVAGIPMIAWPFMADQPELTRQSTSSLVPSVPGTDGITSGRKGLRNRASASSYFRSGEGDLFG